MISLEEIWLKVDESHTHCWHSHCNARAKVKITGMNCDVTPYCVRHLVAELLTHFFGGTRTTIWSKLRKNHRIFD